MPGARFSNNDAISTTPMLARGGGKFFAGGAGNWFSQIEQRMIFALAEILGLKEFGQADDLRAASGSVGHTLEGLGEILFGLWAARHLHQGHTKFIRRQGVDLL